MTSFPSLHKLLNGSKHRYACECDIKSCKLKFHLTHKGYNDLAKMGIVKHARCKSVKFFVIVARNGEAVAVQKPRILKHS